VTAELDWARWAVARWEAFPVEREPRPLVLIGPPAHARNGFRSQRARRAFLDGWIESEVDLPDGVLGILGRRSGGAAPIVVTGARRAEIEQRTDRGPRRLPGWELTSEQTLGPIVVLDPEVLARAWSPLEPGSAPPAGPEPPQAPVRGEVDGATLVVRVTGGVERHPSAGVVESPQAVAVVPEPEDSGSPLAAAFARRITVALSAPLGARVLVDLHGRPSEVTVR
jgi:hypothetical protein